MPISYYYPQDDNPNYFHRFSGIVWLENEPEVRFSIRAKSWEDARRLVEDRWGPEYEYTLADDTMADRMRSA